MPLHKGENPYIYGLHDKGGEHLMIAPGGEAKGWVLVSEAIGSEANETSGGNYTDITSKGLGLIVRLNQSYGTNGTIPREARYPEFAQRVANYAANSQGANIWLIGNEMNFEREQPRQEGSDQAETITPRRYAECYKLCRQKVKAVPGHEDDLVVVGAMAPWNAQTKYPADPQGKYPENTTGDWIAYMRDILVAIGPENCDAIAIHAYSHGYAAELVFSEAKMGNPLFTQYYYNFYTYKDQMAVIPEDMRHLPVYLTEANGDREEHGEPTWPFGNNDWIKNAYKEIDNWNKSGQQQIRCVILFRWMKDDLGWSIDGKPEVQQDFKEAIAKNYKWDQDWKPPKPKPGYLAEYLSHNTPSTVPAAQALDVNLSLQNAGTFDWVPDGPQPFHLGFQWYNAAGQIVSFPSNLDFRTSLPRRVRPGEQVDLRARLRTPDTPGSYQLRWDMVQEQVTWFSSQGDPALILPISVTAAAITGTSSFAAITTAPAVPVTLDSEDVVATLIHNPAKQYPMRTHADIRRIIIHHTATPANVSVERIAEFQVKNKDLPGITYHFCVTAEGRVYQTQYLETVSAHAGTNSQDSVGVCLIGNFTSTPPPQAQLDATAPLLAQLATMLGLTTDQIYGYSELVTTGSPGATWPSWKQGLLARVRRLMRSGKEITIPQTTTTPAGKAIDHYMLFWYQTPDKWAEWDLQGAFDYIARFKPTIGFDLEQAKAAKYVTIVGGEGGVPAAAEGVLRAAGCQVERIAGKTEAETRGMLEQLVAQGKRFRSLK